MIPSLLLRASLVLAASLGLSATPLPAHTRRDLLTLGALSALVLPVLRAAPALELPLSTPASPGVRPVALDTVTGAWTALQEPAGVAMASWPATEGLIALWCLGGLVVAARIVAGVWEVRKLGRGAQPIDPAWSDAVRAIGTSVPVLQHPAIRSPLVLGWFRPRVLVPAVDWTPARRERALRHELAHVASRDTLRLLLAHVLTAVLWFHPLAWMLARRQRLTLEQAADAAVLASGAVRTDYAADLIDLARSVRSRPLVAALGGSPLEQRIRALVTHPERVLPGWLRSGLVAASLGVTAATGLLQSSAVAGATTATDPQALVDAEVARLARVYQPEGLAIVVLDARTGKRVAKGTRGEVGPWAPGSVVKPFVAVAALEEGLIDAPALGRLLEVSDNPGFVELAERLGAATVAKGFGEHGLNHVTGRSPADLALGQFPLDTEALARSYLTLDDSDEGRQVRALLTAVVEGSSGTGKQAAVEGIRVAGKTGTSLLEAGSDERVVASFVGVAPADAPRWVIAVQVAGPQPRGWGGSVAAPAVAHILKGLE